MSVTTRDSLPGIYDDKVIRQFAIMTVICIWIKGNICNNPNVEIQIFHGLNRTTNEIVGINSF